MNLTRSLRYFIGFTTGVIHQYHTHCTLYAPTRWVTTPAVQGSCLSFSNSITSPYIYKREIWNPYHMSIISLGLESISYVSIGYAVLNKRVYLITCFSISNYSAFVCPLHLHFLNCVINFCVEHSLPHPFLDGRINCFLNSSIFASMILLRRPGVIGFKF